MEIKWDIPEKVGFIDPLLKRSLQLGASGEIEVKVSDSGKLLMKLAEMMDEIPQDEVPDMINPLQASAGAERCKDSGCRLRNRYLYVFSG